MECTNKYKKVGFSPILWAIITVLIGVTPSLAGTVMVFGTDLPYELGTNLTDDIYVLGGTLKLMPGGYTSGLFYVSSESTLEIYGSHDWLATDNYIQIESLATVTLFTDSTDSIEFTNLVPPTGSAELVGTTIVVNGTNGWTGKLTWNYQGSIYSLNIGTFSDIIVEVVGSPSPEQLIQDLIDVVEVLNTKEGIVNSLDAKLQNALEALDAANAGQRQDAVNKIQAFINAVEAQSGKAIEEADADLLVDSAQLIISLL